MRILSLREAFKETLGFPKALTQLLDDVHYNQEGEGSCNVHLNEKNTEQVSKLEFMCNVMEKLAELEEVLIYMNQHKSEDTQRQRHTIVRRGRP